MLVVRNISTLLILVTILVTKENCYYVCKGYKNAIAGKKTSVAGLLLSCDLGTCKFKLRQQHICMQVFHLVINRQSLSVPSHCFFILNDIYL